MKPYGAATLRTEAAGVQSAGEARTTLTQDKQGQGDKDVLSASHEPNSGGLALSKTATADTAQTEQGLKDSHAGSLKMSEKAQKVPRDYTGNTSRPGAHAVQGLGVPVALPPPSGRGDGAVTPVGAYNVVSSKAAIANRRGTPVKPSNSPGAVSGEGSSPPQGEGGGGATLVGASGMLASKTAIANRGGTLRPANSPGAISVEAALPPQVANVGGDTPVGASGMLASKTAIANRGDTLKRANAPGAVSVKAALLPPSGEGAGDGTPEGAYNVVSSKAAIASRGGTLRAANAPGAVAVEGHSTLSEGGVATPVGASGMLASKTAIANRGGTLRTVRVSSVVAVKEDPTLSEENVAAPVGASGMLTSETAIANRGGTLRPAKMPGAVAVEEKPILTTVPPSFLTSKEAIANRSTGVRPIKKGANETAVTGTSLQDDSRELSKVNSEKSDTLSVISIGMTEDTEHFIPPSLIHGTHHVTPGAFPVASARNIAAIPMAEMIVTQNTPLDDIERQALFDQARLAAEIDVRNEIISAAVAAEVVDEAEIKDEQRRRRRIRYTCLASIVIVAALVGGLVGGLVSKETKRLPPMTDFPSTAPTETPNNDFCDEALVVTGDSSVYVGSLVNTTIETRFSCSMKVEVQQRGRWYEYPGNGLRLTVSLLSASVDETQVEVFTGDSCGELVCAETDLVQTVDLSFPTSANVIYHILVFSTLNATSDLNGPYTLRVFDNSACGNAYPIDLGLGESQTLQLGSTAAATISDLALPCDSASSIVSPGVWYTIVGRGLNIEASTCSGAAFDTQISVYTGGCGNNLQCVTGNDNSCGTQSSVLWLSNVGQTYYVLVHGASASATGSFELSVVERPVFDTCEGATTLEPLLGGQYSSVDSTTPSTVQGSTIGASFDDVTACGISSSSASGVWYTVIGSGGRMRVFLNDLGEGADFDSRLSVFRGTCTSLECVEQDDSLPWNSTAGEIYSVFVYGVDGNAGHFSLIVDLGNALCSDVANPIPSDGTVFDGSLDQLLSNASTIDGLPVCDPFEPSIGLTAWYSVVGTGTTLVAASCMFFPVFDIVVYTGDCDNLTCVQEVGTGFGDGCARYVSWVSVKDQLYYIRAERPETAGLTLAGLVEYSIRVTEQSPS